MNRCFLRAWIPILPWAVCPLAGQFPLGQKTVVGFIMLLLAVRGSVLRGVCLDPHFRYKCASPRFSAELPRKELCVKTREFLHMAIRLVSASKPPAFSLLPLDHAPMAS